MIFSGDAASLFAEMTIGQYYCRRSLSTPNRASIDDAVIEREEMESGLRGSRIMSQ